MKKTPKRLLTTAVGLAVLVAMVFSIGRMATSDPTLARFSDRRAANVDVEAESDVRVDPPPEWAHVSGNAVVEPKGGELAIAGAVPGSIGQIAVQEGERVQAGALIAGLRTELETAALAEAEARVAAAHATWRRAVTGPRSEQIESASAAEAASRARAESSQLALQRLQVVARAGGVSPDEVDRARLAASADQATVNQSSANLADLVRGTRREDIAKAHAEYVAAQASRDAAAASLDLRLVRAPRDGVVLELPYDVGEYYQPSGAPMAYFGDTSTMQARIAVDERDLGQVITGAAAVCRATAFPGRDFAGTVHRIGQRVAPKARRGAQPDELSDTRTVDVLVDLETADGLLSGQRMVCYLRVPGAAETE
jgi:multidrug resistance efflux pump